MANYEVRRCILDSTNGHHLLRGQIVSTEDTAWVARFGKDLRRAEIIPTNAKVHLIQDTEEGAIGAAKVEEKVAEKVAEVVKEAAPAPVAPKVVTRKETKVVTGTESDAK